MRAYGPERIHNIGIFGHLGSGKTTLAEAMLMTAHAIPRMGRIEDGSTVSDNDPDEARESRPSRHAETSDQLRLFDPPERQRRPATPRAGRH